MSSKCTKFILPKQANQLYISSLIIEGSVCPPWCVTDAFRACCNGKVARTYPQNLSSNKNAHQYLVLLLRAIKIRFYNTVRILESGNSSCHHLLEMFTRLNHYSLHQLDITIWLNYIEKSCSPSWKISQVGTVCIWSIFNNLWYYLYISLIYSTSWCIHSPQLKTEK